MRLKKTLFVALLSASSAAMAQAPADDYSFTGARIEFLGGYVRQLPDVETSGPVTTTSRAKRHSGGSAGIQGGFDLELGPVVAGVFGGYALQTSQGCGQIGGLNQGCLRPQAEAEAGARVGLQLQSRFLAYGKGSYVNTRIETTSRNGATVANSHILRDGWRVGGGVEYAILPKVYVKAEYNYTRSERFNAAPYGFQNTSIDYHTHSALAGFGIRF